MLFVCLLFEEQGGFGIWIGVSRAKIKDFLHRNWYDIFYNRMIRVTSKAQSKNKAHLRSAALFDLRDGMEP